MSTIDSLSKYLRTLLHLSAILGSSFQLLDVILVMEKYIFVRDNVKLEHANYVRKNLATAVSKGILEEVKGSVPSSATRNHVYADQNVTFKFTHEQWRQKLLAITLDDWKSELQGLISTVKAG